MIDSITKLCLLIQVNLEVFTVLQSLVRIGLGSANPAYRRQVERLRDALRANGEIAEAATLERLLSIAAKSLAMQPSRVTVSPAFAGAESLTAHASPPVDRETGAALAEIIFPPAKPPEFPILGERLQVAIESAVEQWQQHELLRAAGLTPPMACLLYGLPGTGKTNLALAMAAKLSLPLVLARLDGVVSSFLGTTGRNIANLFAYANRYNCILLLDEFDAIAKIRDDPHEVGEIKRVVNAILQNIDIRKSRGLTIAITNHEQLLDSAVWRRFDIRIEIPPPGFTERIKIIERYFESNVDGSSARFIAWLTEGMTGADIEVMAKSVRRTRVMRSDTSLLTALQQYSLAQAGRSQVKHRTTLTLPVSQLARELNSSHELSLTQREIGQLLDVSQSQIARWLKESPSSNEYSR